MKKIIGLFQQTKMSFSVKLLLFCLFHQLIEDCEPKATEDPCANEEIQRNCSSLGAKCDINSKGKVICSCPLLFLQPENGEPCTEISDFSYKLSLPIDLNSYRTNETKTSLVMDATVDYFRIKIDLEKALPKIYPELQHINIMNCKGNLKKFVCNIELQSKSEMKNLTRIKNPGVCVIEKGSKDTCLISPSLVLRIDLFNTSVSIKEMDPCDSDLLTQICGSETMSSAIKLFKNGTFFEKFFHCPCMPGYAVRRRVYPFSNSKSYIEECKDVDECSYSIDRCPPNTFCYNTIGSYSCFCMKGYRPKDETSNPNMEGCVEMCNPSPCDHGVCEMKGDNEFNCRCETGFKGILCDLREENQNLAETNLTVAVVVLGIVLIITIVVLLSIIYRLKKKKTNEPILLNE